MSEGEALPAVPKKLKGVYVPDVEKPEHKAMFQYYVNLGKARSLPKVAKEFGKSVAFISTLSRAFGWKDRLVKAGERSIDPVVVSTKSSVDSTRKRMVEVIDDVMDTLHELTLISKKIKASQETEITDADKKRLTVLITALRVYGFEIGKPKDLRDFISTLKDVTGFNDDNIPASISSKTDIHADRVLIVKGLD